MDVIIIGLFIYMFVMYLYGVITHLQNTKACSKLRFSGAPGDKCIPSNASICWETGDKLSCTQCIFGSKETPTGFECKSNTPQNCAALGGLAKEEAEGEEAQGEEAQAGAGGAGTERDKPNPNPPPSTPSPRRTISTQGSFTLSPQK
jgi:hypothetical protein